MSYDPPLSCFSFSLPDGSLVSSLPFPHSPFSHAPIASSVAMVPLLSTTSPRRRCHCKPLQFKPINGVWSWNTFTLVLIPRKPRSCRDVQSSCPYSGWNSGLHIIPGKDICNSWWSEEASMSLWLRLSFLILVNLSACLSWSKKILSNWKKTWQIYSMFPLFFIWDLSTTSGFLPMNWFNKLQ